MTPAPCLRSLCASSTTGSNARFHWHYRCMAAAAPAVELRAFRGTRRSSIYRAHVVAVAAFRRIVGAAADEQLSLRGSLNQNVSVELDKDDARRLADEAKRLRLRASLLELDDDL